MTRVMSQTTTLTPLSPEAHTALLAQYDHTTDPENRTRFQMILLRVEQDLSPRQIAPLVQRSHDTVLRVFHRYQAGGLEAVPRTKGPGPTPKVTGAWEEELLRVIDADPHDHGINAANWTTHLLADYLARTTGITVEQETVRRSLHLHDDVCKRPTWTMAPKAAEREDWVGKGCGGRSF
jgi:transposase